MDGAALNWLTGQTAEKWGEKNNAFDIGDLDS